MNALFSTDAEHISMRGLLKQTYKAFIFIEFVIIGKIYKSILG